MAEPVSFASAYQRRVLDDELDSLFPSLPAVLMRWQDCYRFAALRHHAVFGC